MIYSNEKLFALGVVHGTTTKPLGNMRDIGVQTAFLEKLGLPEKNFLRLKQTHGTNIVEVHTDAHFNKYRPIFEEADAWILTRPNTGIVIMTADCVPLYFWDEKAKTLGLAHAGWRGVAAQLPALIAQRMKKFSEGEISVFTGPFIQKCCFEVKEDVAKVFPNSVETRDGKMYVDLKKEVFEQLVNAGIKAENISLPCDCNCTCSNEKEFFSYRRTGSKDSLMSFMYKF